MKRAGAPPCPLLPAQGRRVPRVKSQPQAGPAGTRSALDAWEYRPVPAPATDPTPLRSTRTSASRSRRGVLRRPPESAHPFMGRDDRTGTRPWGRRTRPFGVPRAFRTHRTVVVKPR